MSCTSTGTMSKSASYRILSPLQALKANPDVLAAPAMLAKFSEWLITGELLVCESFSYSPLFLKMVDEILVNALDQRIKNPNVTEITVSFNPTTGSISVFNNGSYIPCQTHTEYKKWIPEMLFCEFNSGSNFETVAGTDRITGGKNGLGAKIANAFSTVFLIETSDSAECKYYRQRIKTAGSDMQIGEPEIADWAAVEPVFRKPFTRISFIPAYNEIGYKKQALESFLPGLQRLIRTRIIYASIYARIGIVYNDSVISHTTDSLAKLLGTSPDFTISTVAEAPGRPELNWDITICIFPPDKLQCISIINGIHNRDGGVHIEHIVNSIIDPHIERAKKDYAIQQWRRSIVDRYMMVIVRGAIVSPMYKSQAKEYLATPETFPNVVPKSAIDKFWVMMKPILNDMYIKRAADAPISRRKTTVNVKKYESATFAGGAKSHLCTLVIPEGDSAAGFVRTGINDPSTKMGGSQFYGIFNIQGKPLNARKNVKLVSGSDKIERLIRQDSLKDNERLSSLVEVLGLDYTCKYGPEDDKKFKQLRYGRVIIAVDQDVDGVGHICGLLLSFFHLFWPGLIDRGFVQRLATPILQAISTQHKATAFYSVAEYNAWRIAKFGPDSTSTPGFEIRYYKGLAGHNKAGVLAIFKKFNQHLYTYCRDPQTDLLFEVYFGVATDGRKAELRSPPIQYSMTPEVPISCSSQLRGETKEYFHSDIVRSLPHVIDGQRPSSRKIIAAMIQAGSTKLRKVFQIAGDVTARMGYDHGETPLNNSIIRSAQSFPGARNLPFVYGDSEFGSRSVGGDDAGQPRYIFAKLNTRLTLGMFPEADSFILKYVFDEGERCEPLYYVPVLPLAILENYSIPATGWSTTVWARDVDTVIGNVRSMIEAFPEGFTPAKMGYWNRQNASTIYEDGKSILMVGRVHSTPDPLVFKVSELPTGVWPLEWKAKALEKPLVESVTGIQTDTLIDYTVKMKPGFIEELVGVYGDPGKMDIVTHYLDVYMRDTSNLNFLGVNNQIQEKLTYESVLQIWFDERRELYVKRIARQLVYLNWVIVMNRNMNRFAVEYKTLGIATRSREEVDSILETAGFEQLNRQHLSKVSYMEATELAKFIVEGRSFGYLLEMSSINMLNKAIADREKKIADAEAQLAMLTMEDSWKHVWLAEIADLDQTIKLGISEGWDYGKDRITFE